MSRRRNELSAEPDLPHDVRKAEMDAARAGKRSSAEFALGQRWASEMEPELGLGTVTNVEHRRVTLSFQEGSSIRQYALPAAPLKRIRFRMGDVIQTRDGRSSPITDIAEKGGIIVYGTKEGTVPESELSDRLRFTAPLDRLMVGDYDTPELFRLRQRALAFRASIDQSPVKGLIGARIELLPHQLYIAQEVSSRHVRRVLLADEVGLGKTIEACLILHRLLLSGRASRALILVPESMVHVWFVELLRKFNLLFRICGREYFDVLKAEKSTSNPFLDEQLVLSCVDYFVEDKKLRSWLAEAGWDVFIIDEAHHLRESTPELSCVELLAKRSRDVLLLTATPSQFGEQNHFARLRLLDPSRYTDYNSFLAEAENHRSIAHVTAKLLEEGELSQDTLDSLRTAFSDAGQVLESHIQDLQSDPVTARREIVAEILDRHGIGRAVFRNTRASVGGFPSRQVSLVPLEGTPDQLATIQRECLADLDRKPNLLSLTGDSRVRFLAGMLRQFLHDKVLLLCSTKEKVAAIEQALKHELNVNIAVFHEELSLIQRDRNAAYFAEEDGARVLLCSEIGSEGRNFQFVHHLVLFDLPLNPELIEQRIGRLDRIGQKHTVQIHVPYVKGTPYELLARWHHEGIDVFTRNAPAAAEVFEAKAPLLISLLREGQFTGPRVDRFIAQTRNLTQKTTDRLSQGRDRLLEQHSFRPQEALNTVDAIKHKDGDDALDALMIDLFKQAGMVIETIAPRTYRLWSEASLDEVFPGLRGGRPVVTFDRGIGMRREEYEFVTADHPSTIGGLDMVLGSQQGNCSLAQLPPGNDALLLMEALFVVEAIAPPELYVGRFLPPTPLRVLLDHRGRERPDFMERVYESFQQPWDGSPVLEKPDAKTKHLPQMQKKAAEFAAQTAQKFVRSALQELDRTLGGEVARLQSLKAINPAITDEEIGRARQEWEQLKGIISAATPRLDALRLIWRPADSESAASD